MNREFIFAQNEKIIPWVADRVKEKAEVFSGATSIALVEGENIVAAVLYDRFADGNINMHVAAEPGKHWSTGANLFMFFGFPFLQLGCHRVTALVRESNRACLRFCKNLGFVPEGCIRKGFADGENLVMLGMLKEECRWI